MLIFLLLFTLYHSCKAEIFSNIGKNLTHDFLSIINLKELSSSIDQLHSKNIDPEAYMTMEEVIKYHGYPVESYDIQTDDGYILTVQRIPYGKKRNENNKIKERKPVLIQHGFLCQSSSWILNPPESNLPYILVDAGYDVWLSSSRGTSFGRKHINLSPENKTFWQFNIDDMAKYDIPKVIDTILEKTKSSQLYYIAHSMGTTIAFEMLSSQPKYNKIVKAAFLLAPLANLRHITSIPLKFLYGLKKSHYWLLNMIFDNEFYHVTKPIINILSKTLCYYPSTRYLCEEAMYFSVGKDKPQFNGTRLPVYLQHIFGAACVQVIYNIHQILKTGETQYFDFKEEKNLKVYGQKTPPIYDLSKITAPIYLFWGDNDLVVNSTDVKNLAKELKSLALNYRVPFEKFNHFDFLWAVDVKYLLYDKLLDEMNKL